MPHFHRLHRWLAALAGVSLAICATAATAFADPYGELGHFGAAGTGQGQFKLTSGTHAFGVDPADDSVYVGDEPKRGQYRIQKLTGAGAFLAETPLFKPPNHDGIEGIAIDRVDKRVYVLALERRGETAKLEPSQPAAGTLYAFSTEPSEAALAPAGGTTEGVLAGPNVFEGQSDAPEAALVYPSGIAVDPTTHDVIVLGEVGQAPKEGEEPHLHVALQRIHADGGLGERYVDRTDSFGPEGAPNSPVVSPKGDVYVAEEAVNQIAQIPSDFTSTAPLSPFIGFVTGITSDDLASPVVRLDLSPHAERGGGLSLAPEGPEGEGTIYAQARIFLGVVEEGNYYAGALAFDATSGAEIGWTGGQSRTSGSESCAIGFGGPTYPLVAAGGEHRVFMLDPKYAHVVQFGPGGSGCPAAEATTPSATVKGKALTPSETVPTGTPVKLSTTLTQANALSVEWNFGDGQTETVGADEYRHPEVEHEFVRGGELTVTETIHTDDLATPMIVEQTKISVSAAGIPPTAVLEGPSEVTLGGGGALERVVYLPGGGLGLEAGAPAVEGATFDASASFASTAQGANRIETYHWVFGDGQAETTETATVTHRYEGAGVYRVQLTVTDAHESTSQPSTLTVKVNEQPPPAPAHLEESRAPIAPSAEPPAPPVEHPAPPPVPNARLANATLAASPAGTVGLQVTCPIGESSCAGVVTLRTLGAVSVRAAGSRRPTKRSKAIVLTLASGAFTVAGGQRESVTLHLSAQARALLARMHTVRAQATLAAHDLAGASYSSQVVVVLRAAGARHRKA